LTCICIRLSSFPLFVLLLLYMRIISSNGNHPPPLCLSNNNVKTKQNMTSARKKCLILLATRPQNCCVDYIQETLYESNMYSSSSYLSFVYSIHITSCVLQRLIPLHSLSLYIFLASNCTPHPPLITQFIVLSRNPVFCFSPKFLLIYLLIFTRSIELCLSMR
jgi:hypothetical protein